VLDFKQAQCLRITTGSEAGRRRRGH
jgi:hypothetical protein